MKGGGNGIHGGGMLREAVGIPSVFLSVVRSYPPGRGIVFCCVEVIKFMFLVARRQCGAQRPPASETP